MTIQPPSSRPREISVTEPIEPAYDRVKQMLFKPFDLTKWIVIGFCAWLAGLGESGGGGYNGFNGGNNNFGNNSGQAADQMRHAYHTTKDFVLANLDWIVPVAAVGFLLLVALWLLILWLSSRGKFMFLHCVALNVAEVEEPWRKCSRPANSLFRFRIVVGLLGMLLLLPMMVFIAADILRMVMRNEVNMPGVMAAVGVGMVFVLVSIAFALVHKFTMDFVVPIQYLRGGTCVAAWREFGRLLSAHPGKLVLYILFQIVLGMVIGMIVMLAFVATCCILCCLAILPFVGTVVLLPVLIFKRAYPLYYLAQFGPQFDVFPQQPAAPAVPAGTGPTTPPVFGTQ